MDKFDFKKVILFFSGIVIFLILIAVVSSMDTNKPITYPTKPTPTPTTIPTTTTLETPKEIQTPNKTEINKQSPVPTKKVWIEDGSGYVSLVRGYKEAFVTAVNTGSNEILELMLIPDSTMYKQTITSIEKFKSEKTILELKSISLIKFSENGNNITVEVKETIGAKKDVEPTFTYKDYNVKYSILRQNRGLLLDSAVGGI